MRVACVQENVVLGDPMANAQVAVGHLRLLAQEKAQLVLFPEAFLTGYCVGSREEAERIAISRSDPALNLIQQTAAELGLVVVVGFGEQDGGHLYNTAALFDTNRGPVYYRKTHLPVLGYDRFAEPGHCLEPVDTSIGRIGLLICFDLRLPEPTRTLSLRGADIIALPTNWPVGADLSADVMSRARAAENRVFMATCNRVGIENGTTFFGRSRLIGLEGEVIAEAKDQPTVIIADLNITEAQNKVRVVIPGEYETDTFGTRQPDIYA